MRAKVDEELAELDAARAGGNRECIAHEFGDVLLALANLSRHLDLDAEGALRSANQRFTSRFRHLEARVAAGGGRTPEELERYWQEAKGLERGAG